MKPATKNLIYKELKLGLSPVVYVSLIYSLIAFIPNYPPILSLWFPMVTIPQMVFTFASENRDYEFSSLLPIRKGSYVKMKMFDWIYLELLCMILSLPMLISSKYGIYTAASRLPYSAFPGVTSIIIMYGVILFVYGITNLFALTFYFRIFPKYASAILLSILLSFILTAALGIVPAFVPALQGLAGSDPEYLPARLLILVIGALSYLTLNFAAYKISLKELLAKS